MKIGDNISDLFYDDLSLAKGGYDFEVSAQYDVGESARIGPVHVDIYTCFPPTDLTVSLATLSSSSADFTWTPSVYSPNPEWDIEWGSVGFTPGYGTTGFVSGISEYSLTNLVAGVEYDFYVRTHCSSTDASAWVKKTFRTHYVYLAPNYAEQVACDSLDRYWVKITCSTCLTPTNLSAINITGSSADLTWTSNAGLWDIEWGPVGFFQGTGTMIFTTDQNPYTLSGLTQGYAYSYYVRSYCGESEFSNWAGPYEFFIPCPATVLPYSEDFTSAPLDLTPQCWQEIGAGFPSNWIASNSTEAGGTSPSLIFNRYGGTFWGNISHFTSPVIHTTGQTELTLSFKQYIFTSNANPSCEIWTTSNGGSSWNEVWSITPSGAYGPETTYLTITTPDVGSANFRFAFVVSGNSYDIQTWEIDDISLTGSNIGPPDTRSVQNVTVGNGQDMCYDAIETITVAGGGTTCVIEPGGSARMIAGSEIFYYPGTWVRAGGYMLGRISSGGPFCPGEKGSSFAEAEPGSGSTKDPVIIGQPALKIYPNPTNGNFRIELAEVKPEKIRVEIYGMRGEKVLSDDLAGGRFHELSLSGSPAGLYLVKVIIGDRVLTGRLIKAR